MCWHCALWRIVVVTDEFYGFEGVCLCVAFVYNEFNSLRLFASVATSVLKLVFASTSPAFAMVWAKITGAQLCLWGYREASETWGSLKVIMEASISVSVDSKQQATNIEQQPAHNKQPITNIKQRATRTTNDRTKQLSTHQSTNFGVSSMR